ARHVAHRLHEAPGGARGGRVDRALEGRARGELRARRCTTAGGLDVDGPLRALLEPAARCPPPLSLSPRRSHAMEPVSPRQETTGQVRVSRNYGVAPEEVWRAWTDPQALSQWFGPGDPQTTTADIDLRVGGRYRIRFTGMSGEMN